MPAHKWKIFTNENRTRFVAARHRGSVVYDGPSEVEALRAILLYASGLECEPVERQWVDVLDKPRRVSSQNWWPSLYEDNK